MARFFRIHPAVGVARVGNSPDEFFVGPEHPNQPPNFDLTQKKFLPFKDSQGRVKRQAARFRVFEYTVQNGVKSPLREVTAGSFDVTGIKWNVHLANRKAAFFKFNGQDGVNGVWKEKRNAHVQTAAEREKLLVIDPGLKSISGPGKPPVPLTNPNRNIPITTLGELRTDEKGRLLVLGGLGQASKTAQGKLIDDYVNNDHWFDDMSDGPVSAEITYTEGGQTLTAKLEGDTGAWLLVGPPDFGPAVGNVVRMFDTMWDLAVRLKELPVPATDGLLDKGLFARLEKQRADWNTTTHSFQTYKPSFRLEVFPILERALGHRHVHNPEASKSFHASLAGVEQDLGSAASVKGLRLRKTIFNYLRDPSSAALEPLLMPKALGDGYTDEAHEEGMKKGYFMTLTRVQYALLKRWAEGQFEEDWDAAKARAIDPTITAEGLDRAALENGVGGPFFPGIDCSWLVRQPELYAAPFRIKHSGTVFPTTAKLAIGPGFFSQQMALPWQADFYQCKKQFFDPKAFTKDNFSGDGMYHMWWAAHRPDDVYAKKGDIQMVPWTRALEAVAEVEAKKPELQSSAPEGTSAVEMAMYIQMQQNWWKLGFVINEGDAYFETQERSAAPTGVAALRNATRIRLKSWKTDYLQRTNATQGVTTAASGTGTDWNVEWRSDNQLELKSSKGDYLQRADTAQGVTTGASGANTLWIIEANTGSFTLKSSKGDCLHRPDTATGVTTWSEGPGNLWQLEVIATAKVS